MKIPYELIKVAIYASIKAGNAILKIYKTDFSFEKKIDNSPLTIADKESHIIIRDELLSTNLPILSEEGIETPFDIRKNWKRFWMVDPLDGTKEFIKRNDEFTVNIALIENNYPIGGVIFLPVLDVLYFAFDGIGSFKLKNVSKNFFPNIEILELINKSKKLPLKIKKESFTIIASRSHLSDETKDFIKKLKDKHRKVELISRGSSLKFCVIAEGTADI